MAYLGQLGLIVLLWSVTQNLYAEQKVHKEIKVLGKKIEVTQKVASNEDNVHDETSESGVESVTEVAIFGKKIEIAKTSVKYRVSENEGLSFDSNFYVNGRKILAHGLVNGDGSYSYSADIPAAEISGDIFSYSIGILTLGVHSGVSYEGVLRAQVSSEFLKREPEWGTEMNLVDASANVDVMAKGFIEGQVKILFLKGGVGGSLNLIEGDASASISVKPATVSGPVVVYQGIVHLLSGQLYAYVGSGKSKWLTHDFYRSHGHCYAFGSSACQN